MDVIVRCADVPGGNTYRGRGVERLRTTVALTSMRLLPQIGHTIWCVSGSDLCESVSRQLRVTYGSHVHVGDWPAVVSDVIHTWSGARSGVSEDAPVKVVADLDPWMTGNPLRLADRFDVFVDAALLTGWQLHP